MKYNDSEITHLILIITQNLEDLFDYKRVSLTSWAYRYPKTHHELSLNNKKLIKLMQWFHGHVGRSADVLIMNVPIIYYKQYPKTNSHLKIYTIKYLK